MKNHWLKESLHLWKLDDGERHWYVASSKRETLLMHLGPLSPCDGDLPCLVEEVEITQVSDDTVLPVRDEDDEVVNKTAREWCKNGKGLVASTCY